MSCPHAETTAILALFGEAPPEFDDHLRGCADCQETIGAHRETIDLISPHLAPAAPPKSTRLWPAALLSITAAVAAAALLMVSAPAPNTARQAAPIAMAAADDGLDRLDDDLLALELDLALMHLEND